MWLWRLQNNTVIMMMLANKTESCKSYSVTANTSASCYTINSSSHTMYCCYCFISLWDGGSHSSHRTRSWIALIIPVHCFFWTLCSVRILHAFQLRQLTDWLTYLMRLTVVQTRVMLFRDLSRCAIPTCKLMTSRQRHWLKNAWVKNGTKFDERKIFDSFLSHSAISRPK